MKSATATTNQTKLRSFFSVHNLYRRPAPSLAKIAAPLKTKTGKGEQFEVELLVDTEFDAFQELKENLVSPPVLALFRHGYRSTVGTDSCEYQVDYAVLQKQPNDDKLSVLYWSRALTDAKRSYSTTEKSCPAVV